MAVHSESTGAQKNEGNAGNLARKKRILQRDGKTITTLKKAGIGGAINTG